MRVPFTEGLVIKCQNRMLKNRVTASWSKNSQKYFAKGMELEASDAAKNKKNIGFDTTEPWIFSKGLCHVESSLRFLKS